MSGRHASGRMLGSADVGPKQHRCAFFASDLDRRRVGIEKAVKGWTESSMQCLRKNRELSSMMALLEPHATLLRLPLDNQLRMPNFRPSGSLHCIPTFGVSGNMTCCMATRLAWPNSAGMPSGPQARPVLVCRSVESGKEQVGGRRKLAEVGNNMRECRR